MRHLEASPRVPLFVLNVLLQCGRPRVSPLLRHGPTSVSPLLRHGPDLCLPLLRHGPTSVSHLAPKWPTSHFLFLSLSLSPPLSFVSLFFVLFFKFPLVRFGLLSFLVLDPSLPHLPFSVYLRALRASPHQFHELQATRTRRGARPRLPRRQPPKSRRRRPGGAKRAKSGCRGRPRRPSPCPPPALPAELLGHRDPTEPRGDDAGAHRVSMGRAVATLAPVLAEGRCWFPGAS